MIFLKTENDAHEFAAALLMPKEEYKDIVKNNTENGICNIYQVSIYFAYHLKLQQIEGNGLVF